MTCRRAVLTVCSSKTISISPSVAGASPTSPTQAHTLAAWQLTCAACRRHRERAAMCCHQNGCWQSVGQHSVHDHAKNRQQGSVQASRGPARPLSLVAEVLSHKADHGAQHRDGAGNELVRHQQVVSSFSARRHDTALEVARKCRSSNKCPCPCLPLTRQQCKPSPTPQAAHLDCAAGGGQHDWVRPVWQLACRGNVVGGPRCRGRRALCMPGVMVV